MKKLILILLCMASLNICHAGNLSSNGYVPYSIASGTYAQNGSSQYRTEKELRTEEDGYQWYKIETREWSSILKKYFMGGAPYGAEDLNGRTIIPTRYDLVVYHASDKYFKVWTERHDGNTLSRDEGIYLPDGTCVISTDRGYDRAYYRIKDNGFRYCIVEKNGYKGICDRNGKEVISPDEGYTSIIHSESSRSFKGKRNNEDRFEYICDEDGYRKSSSASTSSSSLTASRPAAAAGSSSSASRQYPFTMAYCLDGTAQNISTREIYRQNPTLGYITFFRDKIVIDNRETYRFKQEENGVRAYEGNTLNNNGVSVTPVIFVNENLDNVVLFILVGDMTAKSQIYLMEISDFQALCNRYNNSMNVGQFIDNTTSSSSAAVPSSNRSASFDSRYGYKDCYSCHGTGTCPTCNGRGLQHNSFGLNDSGCANCYRDSSGRRTGKCSTCQGTGKVYGLR